MDIDTQAAGFPELIVKWVDVGVFVVTRQFDIALWNQFMVKGSGRQTDEVVGKNLFDCFPELPRNWLEKKISSVFILKNFAFTSWEQRPYLFKFAHNRPITGGAEHMYQNCTFMPMKNTAGEVEAVCVTLFDATDTAISQTLLKQALEALEESNNRDGLTGIYNRRHLELRLSNEFDRARRYGGSFAFIMFDLDHFKKVNDNFGHLAGDEVLCEVTRRIGKMLRTVDIFGRYGGEEFAVVLPATDMAGAKILAERLLLKVSEKPVIFRDVEIPVTISIGISQFDTLAHAYEQLIEQADTSLYISKETGRNRATCYTEYTLPAI